MQMSIFELLKISCWHEVVIKDDHLFTYKNTQEIIINVLVDKNIKYLLYSSFIIIVFTLSGFSSNL